MTFSIIAKNLVIIGAILGATFLSQQALFASNSKNYLHSQAQENDAPNPQNDKKATSYVERGKDWFSDNIYPRTGGEVVAVTTTIESVKGEIETQKNNLLQNSLDATKKNIAQQILNILGVNAKELDECQAN